MLWQSNNFPVEFSQYNQPENVPEAIELLESALEVIQHGVSKPNG